MPLRPPRLRQRIAAALDGDAAALSGSAGDVPDLVERHQPDLDLEPARRRLAFTTDPWP